MQANSSYLPGSQKSLTWAPEMIMLFWEALQCNKRFRSFIIDTDRSHDFVICMLFYALENKSDASKQGLVRMCIFVLQTMSVESNFGKSLNKRFEGQETLPLGIRIPNFHGTHADYLITVRKTSSLACPFLTFAVNIYTLNHGKRAIGGGISCITSDIEQHCSSCRESGQSDELEIIAIVCIHVKSFFLTRKRV